MSEKDESACVFTDGHDKTHQVYGDTSAIHALEVKFVRLGLLEQIYSEFANLFRDVKSVEHSPVFLKGGQ